MPATTGPLLDQSRQSYSRFSSLWQSLTVMSYCKFDVTSSTLIRGSLVACRAPFAWVLSLAARLVLVHEETFAIHSASRRDAYESTPWEICTGRGFPRIDPRCAWIRNVAHRLPLFAKKKKKNYSADLRLINSRKESRPGRGGGGGEEGESRAILATHGANDDTQRD